MKIISFSTKAETFSGLSDDALQVELNSYARRIIGLRFDMESSENYLNKIRIELARRRRAKGIVPTSTDHAPGSG